MYMCLQMVACPFAAANFCHLFRFLQFYGKNCKIEMSRIRDVSIFSCSKKTTQKWPGIAVPSPF